jgi:L-threonylcarbamoyladenylate synthase
LLLPTRSRMKLIKITAAQPDPVLTALAGLYLKEGKKIIFPTETVYGLGVDAENIKAIEEVYEIKKRPRTKPFSYHFSSLESFLQFAGKGLAPDSYAWFKKLIPNPVTLVYFDSLRKMNIGVRIPDHPVAKAILEKAQCPVLAPSANFSGDKAPICVEEISPLLAEKMDLIVDSGITDNSKESTVIDISVNPVKVLRQGAYFL